MSALQLKMLGGFEARDASGRSIEFQSTKAALMLVCLALRPGEAFSREKLMTLLWSERGENQARGSLRQAVWTLRHAIGGLHPCPLVVHGETLMLDPDSVDSDLLALERHAADGSPAALQSAAALCRGEFLEGVRVRDRAFEEFLRIEQVRVQELVIDILSRLMGHQLRQDSTELAAGTAKRLLAVDPLHEAAHRTLMRHYAVKGQKKLALRQYQTCRDVLRDELEAEPEEETIALFTQIRLSRSDNVAVDDAPVHISLPEARTDKPLEKPSITVLPFSNLSGDPEQDYFSDGITVDITTALSNTGWYDVAACHSAFSCKGKPIDVRQVGKELGVQYVLEGGVRRAGDRVRVTAQLIETSGGKQIWGNRYDGTLADLFNFQDEITETIAGTVEGMFQRAEAERVGQKRPENMQAYDYLLRGFALMNKLTPEDTRAALQYFYKAIEKDPGYSRAYAYASWCYRRQVQERGMMLSEEERAEATRLTETALKADKNDPVVLWQVANMRAYVERDLEGALDLVERSLSIDRNSPRAWNASAMIHGFMGHSDTARKHAEHAIRISPGNTANCFSYAHIAEANLQDMRYQDAADAANKALQFNNYYIRTHLVLAASCAHLGRLDEAQASIRRALELNSKLTITRLSELFPIARYKNLDAYLDGLRKAGLPD